MTQEEFNVVFELQMRKCADILAHKKKEYTGDNIDRLSAFKIAAALQNCCLLYTSLLLRTAHPFPFLALFFQGIRNVLCHFPDNSDNRNTSDSLRLLSADTPDHAG